MTWTTADIPPQHGRNALVTGVSGGGLGYFTALELARAGARVVLAGRSPDKEADAEKAILDLQAPVVRVTGYDVPYPYWQIEDAYMPSAERVADAARRLLEF